MSGASTQQGQNLGQSENGQGEVDLSGEIQDQSTTGTTDSSDGQGSAIRPVEGAEDFTDPLLQGKSPAEIQRLFELQRDALRSQNEELNRRASSAGQESAPAPVVEDDPAPYGDTFLAPMMSKLEERLAKQLEAQVAPLRNQSLENRGQTIRGKLAGTLKHWTVLEPHVDQLIRQAGGDPVKANEQTLRSFYMMAVGAATENGIDLGGTATSTTDTTRTTEQPVTNIPQRRPSSAPLPKPPGQGKRQLTEAEKRLAREYNMTDEEYLAEGEKGVDDVVEPGFSKENW